MRQCRPRLEPSSRPRRSAKAHRRIGESRGRFLPACIMERGETRPARLPLKLMQISGPPPPGISAFDPTQAATPAIGALHRVPDPIVSEGQAVFWRYSSQIFSALLHYSLAGGFSASRVVGVLRETSYLTGDAKDKTYKRLLETTQAIIDYMVRLFVDPLTTRRPANSRTISHRSRVVDGSRRCE